MKTIRKNRFDALVAFTRSPTVGLFNTEISWYESNEIGVTGTVIIDNEDGDFYSILLGKDETDKMRCINVGGPFLEKKLAENWLQTKEAELIKIGKSTFPQGEPKKGVDLFTIIKEKKDRNPNFDLVNTSKGFSPAKGLLSVIAPHFYDVDGNFVEQFQTQGFDSRLWELYLFCYFNDEKLSINRDYEAPDYLLSDRRIEIAVEAVTVGRKTHLDPFDPKAVDKIGKGMISQDEMAIRFGSSLYSKLTHKSKQGQLHYWEYPHTAGKPFVLAIADFHDDFSMTWSSSALVEYLYGYHYDSKYDSKGNLNVKTQKISVHKEGQKEIPSGFFFQPDAENISAVLFSNSGTISKFNRIGKQCGFDKHKILMTREGVCHDFDPNSSKPKPFRYIVTEKSSETWGEGVVVYLNPNAKHPLPLDFFTNAAIGFLDGEIVKVYIPDFYPYSSVTSTVVFHK